MSSVEVERFHTLEVQTNLLRFFAQYKANRFDHLIRLASGGEIDPSALVSRMVAASECTHKKLHLYNRSRKLNILLLHFKLSVLVLVLVLVLHRAPSLESRPVRGYQTPVWCPFRPNDVESTHLEVVACRSPCIVVS